MNRKEPRLDAVFFKTTQGNEPVRRWLQKLPKADRKAIGTDILKVQFCWPDIEWPLVKSLGKGLWEVRSTIGDRIARVLFCVPGASKMVLLHGFIKKTQKTPQREIDIALKRKGN